MSKKATESKSNPDPAISIRNKAETEKESTFKRESKKEISCFAGSKGVEIGRFQYVFGIMCGSCVCLKDNGRKEPIW